MTASTLERAVSRERAPRTGLRPDVQGLRMVAVVAVILTHAIGQPVGGFVGVDVFFVISGYLITGLLLREYERTGRISFRGFYRRRVKRIMPAALLVLGAGLLGSYLLFGPSRFAAVVADAAYSLLFSANWHFALAGTDYFAATGPTSPFQHFWSLAVEEQFYAVWPWLMLVILLALGRRQRHRLWAIGTVLLILTATSFAWALSETATNPAFAYFSTFSRAWELGIGGLLAVTAGALARIPAALRPALGYLGLGVVVASMFVVHQDAGFPAPSALLPVAGAALIIAGGTGSGGRGVLPLTNPVAQWLGDLSYSLYLWHFPVIVLTAALVPQGSVSYFAIVGVVTLVASVLSFYLVENPVRRSALWEGPSGRAAAERRRSARELRNLEWRARISMAPRQTALLAAAALVLVPLTVALLAMTEARVDNPPAWRGVAGPSVNGVSAQPLKGLPASIETALNATAWPKLSPTVDAVLSGPHNAADVNACGQIVAPSVSRCTWGHGSKTAVLVGDSTSMAYVRVLQDFVASHKSWRVVALGAFGCAFSTVTTSNSDASIVRGCPARNTRDLQEIASLRPEVVFVTNTYEPRANAAGGAAIGAAAWADSVQQELDRLGPLEHRAVLLSPPPSQAVLQTCFSKLGSPSDCVTHTTADWLAANTLQSRLSGIRYVDSRRWFCVQDRCPAFVGSTVTKFDLVHMTSQYADRIAPYVASYLVQRGILS